MLGTTKQLRLTLEEAVPTLVDESGPAQLRTAGLFAGIGGIELGLERARHETRLLCEIEPAAAQVLERRFGMVPHADVSTLRASDIPEIDLLSGGFPCQDLSQAGRTKGIGGSRSGLVDHMFRLLDQIRPAPTWVLFENVPFMLQLDRGQAMAYLTQSLADMGWVWAYRVVDTRAFGLPQRRRRVIFLASKTHDPRSVLFGEDAGERSFERDGTAFGFYWTEGRRGLGWAVDAVPTLKGGSSIGIPSPPAIWMPDDSIVTPDIRDAERLQGFRAGWTSHDGPTPRKVRAARWKMVGNAVSVPVARWVGRRLVRPKRAELTNHPVAKGRKWPNAAWGYKSEAFAVERSAWPVHYSYKSLAAFLKYPTQPLSLRATSGFRSRTREAKLRFDENFLAALDRHIEKMKGSASDTAA